MYVSAYNMTNKEPRIKSNREHEKINSGDTMKREERNKENVKLFQKKKKHSKRAVVSTVRVHTTRTHSQHYKTSNTYYIMHIRSYCQIKPSMLEFSF